MRVDHNTQYDERRIRYGRVRRYVPIARTFMYRSEQRIKNKADDDTKISAKIKKK